MKKTIRSLLALSMSLQFSLNARAESDNGPVNISNILALRETMNLHESLKQVGYDLNYPTSQAALKMWKSAMIHSDHALGKQYLEVNARKLRPYIGNDGLITLFNHYMYTGQPKMAGYSAVFYYLNMYGMLANRAYNPITAKDEAVQLSPLIAKANSNYINLLGCVEKWSPSGGGDQTEEFINKCLANSEVIDSKVFTAVKTVSWVKEFHTNAYLTPTMISPTGYIPGNKVDQLVQINHSADYLKKFGALTQKFIALKCEVCGSTPYASMTAAMFADVMNKDPGSVLKFFTEEGVSPKDLKIQEGKIASGDMHPALMSQTENGERNIFAEFYKEIDKAEESIFVDVFFLGGSLGATIARKLVQKAQIGVKVFIINDARNSLGFAPEMNPVYNYLRGYSKSKLNDKKNLFITEPYVDVKKTSLPSFIDLMISDDTVHKLTENQLLEKSAKSLGFYLKGKSDHSKVYIIDGNIPLNDTNKNKKEGVAFVGSKNLTDSSGGIAYDETSRIEGPAVRVILDSYYYDLLEAFANDASYQAQYKMTAEAWRAEVKNLLKPLDVLGRASGQGPNTVMIPRKSENTTIMIGENTVYGVTRSAVLQDINAIMGAKRQILISEQFLYDADIVRALIKAKQRNTNLQVKVLLAPIDHPMDLRGNNPKQLAHIPNILFLKDMLKPGTGIDIRWKAEPDNQTDVLENYKNGTPSVVMSPEYHIKGLSIDGVPEGQANLCAAVMPSEKEGASAIDTKSSSYDKSLKQLLGNWNEKTTPPLLISGSANKDNMTMLGGFREFQVGIYDPMASIRHDCMFWLRWTDTNFNRPIDINRQFLLPTKFKELGFSPDTLIQLMKEAFIAVYDFTIEYTQSSDSGH